jgi:uncharacterized phiE125 gp8 family phage protein
MLAPVRTSAPATNPITLAEAKAHLRVSHTAEDELIAFYIDAAVAALDGWSGILGRCMVTQTWRQDYGCFSDEMRLPMHGVASVTVTYYDSANAMQTLGSSNYALVNRRDGAAVVRSDSGSFPSTYDRPDAVQVAAVCGYGAASAVPAALKAAILLHVGALFEGRADGNLPPAYGALISPYRLVGI